MVNHNTLLLKTYSQLSNRVYLTSLIAQALLCSLPNNEWSETTTKGLKSNGTRSIISYKIIGSILRNELNKERVTRIDLSYLGHQINLWWAARSKDAISHLTQSDLKMLILEVLKTEHLEMMQNMGVKNVNGAAVLIEHSFSCAESELGLLVHEVMAGIAGIVDIKYP